MEKQKAKNKKFKQKIQFYITDPVPFTTIETYNEWKFRDPDYHTPELRCGVCDRQIFGFYMAVNDLCVHPACVEWTKAEVRFKPPVMPMTKPG